MGEPKRLASPYGAAVYGYPPPLFGDTRTTQVPLVGQGGWIESLDNPVQEESSMPQKPDAVVAKNDKQYAVHPVGQFGARCVDVIDLGETVITYPGSQPCLGQKVALVFWTGEKDEENGKDLNLSVEFTVSMGKKANMRKFLESWRGQSYTEEQAKEGVPIDRLYGQLALLSTEHKPTKAGNTFCAIASISPLPKVMQSAIPKVDDIAYERDEWWAKKKEGYAKEATEFRKQSRPKASASSGNDFEGFPGEDEVESEDSLPF